MTNKFISIVLSLALITTLLPMMSVSAADEAINIFEESFEAWTDGTKYYEGFTGPGNLNAISHNDISRFNLGKHLMAEIVSMDGYDGNPTKAIKVTSNHSDTGLDLDVGQGRFKFSGSGVTYTDKGSYTPTNNYVTEFKMYIPESINSGGETISQSIGSFNFGPFAKSGSTLVLRYTKSNGEAGTKKYTDALTPGWHKFTIVQLCGSESGKMIYYHNDKLLSYKEYALANATNMIQFTSTVKIPGQHLIFDDFRVYEGFIPTTASSEFNNAIDVSRWVNPTVTFSSGILNTDIGGNLKISASNAVVTKAADSSAVAVNELTLSEDGKTITVDIKDALDYSETYNVKLTGLKDIYDNVVPDYDFSFTVVDEPPYASSEPVFTKLNDFTTPNQPAEEISSLENGYISANYAITNNHDSEAKDVVLFAVLREGSALKAIEFKQGTVQPRKTLTLNAGFDIDDYYNQTIEIYIWDNFADKNALAPSYLITKDSIETTAR